MNWCCENCGWTETVGTTIICNYSEHRTWCDECCEAWKPKEKETNMVEVVRCKNCDNKECWGRAGNVVCGIDGTPHRPDWFCADGERKDDNDN